MATMETVIDLKTNRALLNSNFECYRLNTKNLRVNDVKLEVEVARPKLSSEKFGFCHAQLQSKRNALLIDNFNPGLLFYIGNGGLYRSDISNLGSTENEVTNEGSVKCVYKLGDSAEDSSLNFFSNEQALLLESGGKLTLLDTGNRLTNNEFKASFVLEICLQDALLLDAKRISIDGKKSSIHILTCCVKNNDDKTFETSVNFKSCLEWIQIDECQDINGKTSWNLTRRAELYGKSVPRFTSFLLANTSEGTCQNPLLLVSSDCRYHADSEDNEKYEEKSSPPLYSFTQDDTETTLTFALENDVSKKNVDVFIGQRNIKVGIKGKLVIENELHDAVDTSCSTWLISDSKLEITLMKQHPARWPQVLKNDNRGTEILDPAYVDSVHEKLQHLTADEDSEACRSGLANSTSLEECDEAADEFFVQSFTFESQRLRRTSFANLTGHQYLMEIQLENRSHMVLRHDTDGLVWKFDNVDGAKVSANHIHTLNAFGYVAASKTDRVLLTGCLEAGFVAIVDSANNVFLYEQMTFPQAKNGTKPCVLSQYVFRVQEGVTPVIGGHLNNNKLLLLTVDTLHVITLPK